LFASLAASLATGNWLGPYNNRTLIKGVGYPLWIASNYLLGVPLLLAQNLLYVASRAVFVIALLPLFSRLCAGIR
jgi:hypothetical protein